MYIFREGFYDSPDQANIWLVEGSKAEDLGPAWFSTGVLKTRPPKTLQIPKAPKLENNDYLTFL